MSGSQEAQATAPEALQASAEDLARQALYAFFARVLAGPMADGEVVAMEPFANPGTPLGDAAIALIDALNKTDGAALEREHHDLFIGVGRGELLPYASYYLTGFLNEKPLAELRNDMARLGFERVSGVHEPEDHLASLCDIMSHLIEGTAMGSADLYDQDQFFRAHILPWAGKFFADLGSAKTADAYRTVGRIGEIFIAIEEEGFSMIARA